MVDRPIKWLLLFYFILYSNPCSLIDRSIKLGTYPTFAYLYYIHHTGCLSTLGFKKKLQGAILIDDKPKKIKLKLERFLKIEVFMEFLPFGLWASGHSH
jgi:hypothetical protein